ncbi:hypothetical protein F2Q68_00020411 [Brassica cretica]|uniref:Uncharacterized protein n=1 Tax=Brassica cretica TaxID=69181 RepID=A0A8S9FWQ0_BRACR|nr:hypothetical protein F2Q68_00020411 [Brassica cretica]
MLVVVAEETTSMVVAVETAVVVAADETATGAMVRVVTETATLVAIEETADVESWWKKRIFLVVDCYNSDLPKTLILGTHKVLMILWPKFAKRIYKGKAALPKLCKSSAFSKSLESKVLKLQVSYADEARN